MTSSETTADVSISALSLLCCSRIDTWYVHRTRPAMTQSMMNANGRSGTGAFGKFDYKLAPPALGCFRRSANLGRLHGTDPLAGVAVWRLAMMERMSELVFEVVQEADGGYCAECLTESIFTQADSWDELRRNVREAVTAFYFDGTAPASVRLHLVRDEILSVA
jgi:hypothetical protein